MLEPFGTTTEHSKDLTPVSVHSYAPAFFRDPPGIPFIKCVPGMPQQNRRASPNLSSCCTACNFVERAFLASTSLSRFNVPFTVPGMFSLHARRTSYANEPNPNPLRSSPSSFIKRSYSATLVVCSTLEE